MTAYQVTDGDALALIDTDQNFKKWGVEAGDLVTQVSTGLTMVVTGVSTTTNENDTLATDEFAGTWSALDEYKVEQRDYVQVGDLVQVKVDETSYIDFDYLVTAIEYAEPSFICSMRVSRNLIAPSIGDQQSIGEIMQNIQDTAQRSGQRGSYN